MVCYSSWFCYQWIQIWRVCPIFKLKLSLYSFCLLFMSKISSWFQLFKSCKAYSPHNRRLASFWSVLKNIRYWGKRRSQHSKGQQSFQIDSWRLSEACEEVCSSRVSEDYDTQKANKVFQINSWRPSEACEEVSSSWVSEVQRLKRTTKFFKSTLGFLLKCVKK